MHSAEKPVNVPISIARPGAERAGEQLHERALLGRDLEGGRGLAPVGHRGGLGQQVGGDVVGRLGGGAHVVGEFRGEEERPGRHRPIMADPQDDVPATVRPSGADPLAAHLGITLDQVRPATPAPR